MLGDIVQIRKLHIVRGRGRLERLLAQAELGRLDEGLDDEPGGDGHGDVHDLVAVGEDVKLAAEEPLRGVGGVEKGPNQLEESHQGQGLHNVGHLGRPVDQDKVGKGQAPQAPQEDVDEGTQAWPILPLLPTLAVLAMPVRTLLGFHSLARGALKGKTGFFVQDSRHSLWRSV